MKKTCSGCGREIRAWSKLPFVGYQDDGKGGRLEMRNCTSCNSTLCGPVALRQSHRRTRRREVAVSD